MTIFNAVAVKSGNTGTPQKITVIILKLKLVCFIIQDADRMANNVKLKYYLFYFYCTDVRKLIELINTFSKARIIVFCGLMWWKKPEYPEETNES